MKIQIENTAISTGVSKSTLELELYSKKDDNILDYGAGKLRNAKYLLSKELKISVLDTPFQLSRISKSELDIFVGAYTTDCIPNVKYDKILCSFVLNVIPEPIVREQIIQNAYTLLKENGALFLEVRREAGILQNKYKEPYSDGFLIGKNETKTFQKPFTEDDLVELFRMTEFTVEQIKKMSDSYIVFAYKGSSS